RSRWLHEDRLGQARMTWFVASQALLFLPFATATTPALKYTLPVIGVGLTWMLVVGLRACGVAMRHLRREHPTVETIPGGLPVFGATWTFVPALLFQTAWVLLLLEALNQLVLALVVVPVLAAFLFGFARAVVPDGSRWS
ncbi:MAG: hypothetical protein O2816_13115, partial [Planctomycetota bacterium]|nr:hypothetical protein [Planctomycetota bacterium]